MKLRIWYSIYGTVHDPLDSGAILASLRPPVPGLMFSAVERAPSEPNEIGAFVRAPAQLLGPGHADSVGNWRHGYLWSYAKPEGMLIAQIGRHHPPEETFEKRLRGLPEFMAHFPDDEYRARVADVTSRANLIVNLSASVSLGDLQLARICEQICGHVCRATDGVIQVYQEGFFDQEGESLLPRNPQHRLMTR